MCACDPAVTRRLASCARRPGAVFVPRDAGDAGESHGTADGDLVRMTMATQDFKCMLSARSRRRVHASHLESGALCMGLRQVLRSGRRHRSRCFVLLDSQALIHAVRKGRSGASNFWHGSRMLASMLLACEVQLHCGYIPSAFNPADGPSRGLIRPKGKVRVRPKRDGFLEYVHQFKRSVRRLKKGPHGSAFSDLAWDSSDSDSCTVQPP